MPQIIFYDGSVEDLINKIENCKNSVLRRRMIEELPDAYKISYVEKEKNFRSRALIVATFKSDQLKLRYIDSLFFEDIKVIVIKEIQDDLLKVQQIETLKREYNIEACAETLKSNVFKFKYLPKLSSHILIYLYLQSFKTGPEEDDKIINFLKENNNERINALLISLLSNDDLKIKYLENIKNEFNKANILSSLDSDELKLEYIKTITDSKVKAIILASLKDDKIKEKYFAEKNQKYTTLDIDDNMTIGIEIECFGKAVLPFLLFENSPFKGYNIKIENSIEDGVEFTSPILKNKVENVKSIYTVCNMLKSAGFRTNSDCAAHIHIGRNYLKTEREFEIAYELFGNTEKILYNISNIRNSVPRTGIREFARPSSKLVDKAIKDAKYKHVHSRNDRSGFIEVSKLVQQDRYTGVNIDVGEDKETIEFRFANGTLNANQWIENINLFSGILQASKRIANILNKNEIDLTEDEKRIINEYRLLKRGGVSEKKKLKILLDLSVPKDKWFIYLEKYRANHSKILMQQYQEVNDEINKRTAQKVDFSEMDIEK